MPAFARNYPFSREAVPRPEMPAGGGKKALGVRPDRGVRLEDHE